MIWTKLQYNYNGGWGKEWEECVNANGCGWMTKVTTSSLIVGS